MHSHYLTPQLASHWRGLVGDADRTPLRTWANALLLRGDLQGFYGLRNSDGCMCALGVVVEALDPTRWTQPFEGWDEDGYFGNEHALGENYYLELTKLGVPADRYVTGSIVNANDLEQLPFAQSGNWILINVAGVRTVNLTQAYFDQIVEARPDPAKLIAWADALDSGKYQFGKGALRDKDECYCCLGVLADLQPSRQWSDAPDTCYGLSIDGQSLGAMSICPSSLGRFLGTVPINTSPLIDENDYAPKGDNPHPRIAAFIREVATCL